MEFRNGDKFGVVAVPSTISDLEIDDNENINNQLWITKNIPVKVDDTWLKWLGSIEIDKIQESNLFILAKCQGEKPELLDEDNRRLVNITETFYLGLTLSGFFYAGDGARSLTGVYLDGRFDIRQIGKMSPLPCITGAPVDNIDKKRLMETANITESILNFRKEPSAKRIKRTFGAYIKGIESGDIGDRIHQFCRCLEGFIVPDIGKTKSRMISRTKLFIGDKFQDDIADIYALRSAVEHLHNPIESFPDLSLRGRGLKVARLSIMSEAIARYCLERILLNQQLKKHFYEDEDIKDFWKLDDYSKRGIWGDEFDVKPVLDRFEPEYLSDRELGIS